MAHLSLLFALLVAQATPQDLEARRKQLAGLLDEQWEYTLRTHPEFASILGDKRYNDKLSDCSQAAIDDDLATERRSSPGSRPSTTGFPEQELSTRR